MRQIVLFLFLLSILTLPVKPAAAESAASEGSQLFQFKGIAEFGFVAVLSHMVQFGKNGTNFDYVKNGGQDVLFPVQRYSVEVDVGSRNTFILLYQPLRIESQTLLARDVIFDDQPFLESTGLKCLYSFPFYRASYLREFLPNNPKSKLALGLTLQIRNALISFESLDGSRYRTGGGIGIVPAFKVRARTGFAQRFFAEVEADGIYAPVSYLNGSDNEIVGAILDASVRIGAQVRGPVKVFVNLRYLGGGATGTNTNDPGPGDGYVKNWLHFLTVTTGLAYQF